MYILIVSIVVLFVTGSMALFIFALENKLLDSALNVNNDLDKFIKIVTFIITVGGSLVGIYNFFKKIGNEEINPILKKLYSLKVELGKKKSNDKNIYAELIVDINKLCNEILIGKMHSYINLKSKQKKIALVEEMIEKVTDMYRKKIDITYLCNEKISKPNRRNVKMINEWFDKIILKIKIATKIYKK